VGYYLFLIEKCAQFALTGLSMLNLLHGYYKPIFLSLLAVLGFACGHLIDTVLQINLHPGFKASPVVGQLAAIKPMKTAAADLNLILQNNLFDRNNRSAGATMTLESGSESGADSSSVGRADLKLFGTVVAEERSLVLLEVNKELKLYHLGDKVPGDGSIEEVRRNQVNIRNRDQSLTTLLLHEQEPLSARAMPAIAENGRDTGGDIREVGENRWLISRSMVEAVRENFADQLRLAQMEPRAVDGKIDGFLVKRINPRSVLVKMGLQRGDVVKEVNNIKLDSPEKALQVFQQLREARQIAVAVERNGQPMNFSYEIN
jgi:general secretion pathway protein C